MPIFCAAEFISGLHGSILAVVEAMSLATKSVVITTIGSWVVMLPASYLLGIIGTAGCTLYAGKGCAARLLL
uniref:Uncharacterized protein n=1 Tax=Peronospora matthiolae TaxID=2874970 RepID=A0AAV1UG96_9STRA